MQRPIRATLKTHAREREKSTEHDREGGVKTLQRGMEIKKIAMVLQ